MIRLSDTTDTALRYTDIRWLVFTPLFLGRFEHWNELHKAERDDHFVQNVCYPVIIGSGGRSSKNAGAQLILSGGVARFTGVARGRASQTKQRGKRLHGRGQKERGVVWAVAALCTDFANKRNAVFAGVGN